MKTTVEELIKQRSFNSLTASEREEISELCPGEEDFVRMKQFLLGVETMSQQLKTAANPSLKSSLDNVFAAKHPGARVTWNGQSGTGPAPGPIIPLYRRNWVRVAAVALLVLGSTPFFLWQTDAVEQEAPQLAKLEEMKSKDENSSGSTNSTSSETAFETPAPVLGKNAPAGNQAAFDVSSSDDVATYKMAESDNVSTPAFEKAAVAQGSVEALNSAGSSTYAWSGTAAPAASGTYSLSTNASTSKSSAAKAGFAADIRSTKDSKVMNRGRLADLEPGKGDQATVSGSTVNTRSMAEQPEELFDLLVPAF